MISADDPYDPRSLWLAKSVSCLLLQEKQWTSAELSTPFNTRDNPEEQLRRFLDEAPQDSVLFFFTPEVNKSKDETAEHLRDPPTAMSSFHWESSSEDVFTSTPSKSLVLHMIEGLPPSDLGNRGVIVRKSIFGKVPLTDENNLSLHLQFIFIHKNYRESLQILFNEIYLPLIERVGKNDPTGYLSSLAKELVRTSTIEEKDIPFVVSSEESRETNETQESKLKKRTPSVDTEGGEEGEEGSTFKKDPKDFLHRSLNKVIEKYSKDQGDNTLTELREKWSASHSQLSTVIAFALSNPVIASLDAEQEKADELAKKRKKKRLKKKSKSKLVDEQLGEEFEDSLSDVKAEEQPQIPESEADLVVPEETSDSQEADNSQHETEEQVDEESGRIVKTCKKKKKKKKNVVTEQHSVEVAKKLKNSLATLVRQHSQLTDCHRSLFYLENCFKVVRAGNVEELGGRSLELMKTLEMVWRVGRRNGISGRVQILLEASIQSLVDLITRELRPVNLLPSSLRELQPLLDSQTRVNKSEAVVSEWEKSVSMYSTIIWNSDKRQKDGRHDFDPRKVVITIQDLRNVCKDLQDILKELVDVQVVLSPEWSSLVTSDNSENLKAATIQALKILTAYDFNIFSPRNKDRWVRQKEDFQRSVQEWEQVTLQAVKNSFKNRLTSELVSAVTSVLKKEPCRPVFRELLLSYLPSLMSAFAEEVKGIQEDFESQSEVPRPGCQAPIAGRVRWMNAYLRKRLAAWTILKELYVTHKNDPASHALVEEIGQTVDAVRKEVEKTKNDEVHQWKVAVNKEIPKLLVTPVLTKDSTQNGKTGWGVELPGALQTVVWESGQLIQGGFQPPPLALHFSLHYPTLQTAAMKLQTTLRDYNLILDSLNPSQMEVMKGELMGTERVLEAGRRVVTWSPASLTHFSNSCKEVVDHVTLVTTKLLNITHRLEDFSKTISETNLMSRSKSSARASFLTFMELMQAFDEHRIEQVKQLQEIYGRLVSTLKATSALLMTSSDTCPETLQPHLATSPDLIIRIQPFLKHWKEKVQKAITDMIVGTMSRLQKSLRGEIGHDGLFQVGANLTTTGSLCFFTPARDLVSELSLALGKVVRCAMKFHHWTIDENGGVTLDTKTTMDEDSLSATSFYNQISKDEEVHEAIVLTQNCFADVILDVDIELQKWYSFEHVWQRDKDSTVRKFSKTSATIRQYDDKLRFYKELSENLQESKHYTLCHSVRLNLESLIEQIMHHANLWIQLLGLKLRDTAELRLNNIRVEISRLENGLSSSVADFDSLRTVLLAARKVRTNYSHFTSDLQEVRVMFHILKIYNVKFNAEYLKDAEDISTRIETLHPTAWKTTKKLQRIYEKFQNETKVKQKIFTQKVTQFQERYNEHGPGSVGPNLDLGLMLLKEYSAELKEFIHERNLLEEDVDVFDLPEIQCEPIEKLSDDINILTEVYEIYKKLKFVENSWRSLRFATASLEEIEKDLIEIEKMLGLRKELLHNLIGNQLKFKLERHLRSLTIIATLRQPAIQQRHWDYLLKATNELDKEEYREANFMNVSEVLQMNLSEHEELVNECVFTAKKETRINEQIDKIREFWLQAKVSLNMNDNLWFLDGVESLMESLHQHHVTLKILRSSSYSTVYYKEIWSVSEMLMTIDDLLKKWQKLHSGLNIVLSPAISPKLPLAEGMHSKYRQLLELTQRRPYVSELASKSAYLDRVDDIFTEASDMLLGLTGVLGSHRDRCPRLYFLSDYQLSSFISSEKPTLYLELILQQMFNNVSRFLKNGETIMGLVSSEGEELHLVEPVKMFPGEKVSKSVQLLLQEIKKSTKNQFENVIDILNDEDSITPSLLSDCITSQIETGWLLMWTSQIEKAFELIKKGNRFALRESMSRIVDDINVVFSIMGRLVHSEIDSDKMKYLKPSRSYSESRKSWSASGQMQDSFSEKDTTRGASGMSSNAYSPLSWSRLQPFLLTLLRCRDVVALLLQENSRDATCFHWQLQPRYFLNDSDELILTVMHKQIKYGFEFRGCGSNDFILTPNLESSLITLLSTLAMHKPALLTEEPICGASGRQSLAQYAAHLSGKLFVQHHLNPESDQRSLRKLIKGCVLDGCFLMMRNIEVAPPESVSFLASTLFKIYNAHSHPHSPGIIQLGNEDLKIDSGLGFILLPSSPVLLPTSVLNLCQKVFVPKPDIRTLLYSYLLAYNVPQPHALCSTIYEIMRHLEGPELELMKLYPKNLLQILSNILPLVSTDPEMLPDLILKTCRDTLAPWLSKEGLKTVNELVEHLMIVPDHSSAPTTEDDFYDVHRETISNATKQVLASMNKTHIPAQIEKIGDLVSLMERMDSQIILVVGPPRCGKATIIEGACRCLTNIEDVLHDLSRRRDEFLHDDQTFASIDTAFDKCETNFEEEYSNEEGTEGQLFYCIAPHAFNQRTLLGSEKNLGLFPNVLKNLSNIKTQQQRFVVLEGLNSSNILRESSNIPGFLSLDTGLVWPIPKNVTFVVKVTNLDTIPEWVRARGIIFQLDSSHLCPKKILGIKEDEISQKSLSKSEGSDSFLEEINPKESQRTPKETKHLFSQESSMDVQSILYYLMKPFLQDDLTWTTIPLTSIDLVQEAQFYLQGLEIWDKSLKKNKKLSKPKTNVVLVINAVILTLSSTFSPEFRGEIDIKLRRLIENLLLLGSINQDQLQIIQQLLSLDTTLDNVSYNPDDCLWSILQPSKALSKKSSVCPSSQKSDSQETEEEEDTKSAKSTERFQLSSPEIETLIFVDPLEIELNRLSNVVALLNLCKRPLLVVGDECSRKTHCVLTVLKDFKNTTILYFEVTKLTEVSDFEKFLLGILKRKTIDTLEANQSTVLVINHLEFLKENTPLLTYIQTLIECNGIYHPNYDYCWTIIKNIYIIGILSLPMKMTWNERIRWKNLKGWILHTINTESVTWEVVYHMSSYTIKDSFLDVSEAIRRITYRLIKESKHLDGRSTHSKLNRHDSCFHFLKKIFCASSDDENVSSSMHLFMLWFLSANMEFVWPIATVKKQTEASDALMTFIKEEPSLCCFLGNFDFPKFVFSTTNDLKVVSLGEKSALQPIFTLNFYSKPYMVSHVFKKEPCWNEESRVIPSELDHRDITENVSMLMASLLSPIYDDQTANLILVVGPPTPDIFIIIEISATLLGHRLIICQDSEEAQKMINFQKQNDSNKDFIIGLPAHLLQDHDLIKLLLQSTSDCLKNFVTYPKRNWKFVIIANENDTEYLQENLSFTLVRNRTLRLKNLTKNHHKEYAKILLENLRLESDGIDDITEDISEFLGKVHDSILSFTTSSWQGKMDFEYVALDSSYPSPSVAVMKAVVEVFLKSLRDKRESIHSELSTLRKAIEKSKSIQTRSDEIRTNNENVGSEILKTTDHIDQINKTIQSNKTKITEQDDELEKLREDLIVAEKLENELSEEVLSYERETNLPLQEACENLREVDMDRVNKLVSRSPLTAVQIVFECAVMFLGAIDTTWKAVRQTTNSPTFCINLADLHVPSLSKQQIEAVIEKLKQVKISEDHMSRMSDIGCVLLKYLKTAVFLWRRFHEDVKPRQERVQILCNATIQLQNKIKSGEKLIKDIKVQMEECSKTLKKEEIKLRELKSQKSKLEKDLGHINKVIEEHQSHILRWLNKVTDVESKLKYLPGINLLLSVTLNYLAPMPSSQRAKFVSEWKSSLSELNLINDEKEATKTFRMILASAEQDEHLSTIIDYQKSVNPFAIMIRDPHDMETTILGTGKRLYLNSLTWKDELLSIGKNEPNTLVYLQGHHDSIVDYINWKSSNLDEKQALPSTVLCLTDECFHQPCWVCFKMLRTDISLNNEGLGYQLCKAFLRSVGRQGLETRDKLENFFKNHAEIKTKRKVVMEELMFALTQSQDFKTKNVLEHLFGQAQNLNKILVEEVEIREEISKLTEIVQAIVEESCNYAKKIFFILQTLKILSIDYAISFPVFTQALTQTIELMFNDRNAIKDPQEETRKELKKAVTIAAKKLLHIRIAWMHRLPVGVIMSVLESYPLESFEIFLRGFLEPLDDDAVLWKDIPSIEAKDKFDASNKLNLKENEDFQRIESLLKDFKSEEVEVQKSLEDSTGDDKEFKTCDKRVKYKISAIMSKCQSLFKHPEATGIKSVLDFAERKTDKLVIEHSTRDANALVTAQEIILCRHVREDLFLEKSRSLIKMVLRDDFLQPIEKPLEEGLRHTSYITMKSYTKMQFLLKVYYHSSLKSDLVIKVAASRMNVKQYKITHISLPCLSTSDIHYEILKASRRRTWLVVHDAELVPKGFHILQKVLMGLSDDSSPPTVMCLMPFGPQVSAVNENIKFDGVIVRIEGVQQFKTALERILPKVVNNNIYEEENPEYAMLLKSASISTAFIHSILVSREHYKASGWISNDVLIKEEDFKGAIELLSFHLDMTRNENKIPWETITNSILQITYKNSITHPLDFMYTETLVNGYLGQVTIDQDALIESVDLQIFKNLCATEHLKDIGNMVEHLCEHEQSFLGLPRKEFEETQLKGTLKSIENYSTNIWVKVPWDVVKEIIRLIKICTKTKLQNLVSTVERQNDLETTAWELEVTHWDQSCRRIDVCLVKLLKASKVRNFSPAEILLFLEHLVDDKILPPKSSSRIKENCYNDAKENFIERNSIKQIIEKVTKLLRQLNLRFKQLNKWVLHESPPSEVRLGALRYPNWWLMQFRRAVCIRAHWNLNGSLLYCIPAPNNYTPRNDRPPQGVYLTGCQLIGAHWNGNEICGDDDQTPLTLWLTVGHSKPVAKPLQKWIPVLDPTRKGNALLEAILPISGNLRNSTDQICITISTT